MTRIRTSYRHKPCK